MAVVLNTTGLQTVETVSSACSCCGMTSTDSLASSGQRRRTESFDNGDMKMLPPESDACVCSNRWNDWNTCAFENCALHACSRLERMDQGSLKLVSREAEHQLGVRKTCHYAPACD